MFVPPFALFRMASSWPLVVVAVLLLGCAPGLTSAVPCPDLDVGISKLTFPSVLVKDGIPAGHANSRMKIVATLSNTGSTKMSHVTFRLQLPAYLLPLRTSTRPLLKPGTQKLPLVEKYRDLYWTGLSLPPGKTRKFLVTALIPACQDDTDPSLTVQASAYVTASDGETVTCLNNASPADFRVFPALKNKADLSKLGDCVCAPPVTSVTTTTITTTVLPGRKMRTVSFLVHAEMTRCNFSSHHILFIPSSFFTISRHYLERRALEATK